MLTLLLLLQIVPLLLLPLSIRITIGIVDTAADRSALSDNIVDADFCLLTLLLRCCCFAAAAADQYAAVVAVVAVVADADKL